MSQIGIKVEILFDPSAGFYDFFVLDSSTLDGAAILASDQEWVDITDDIIGIVDITRGRQRDLDEFTPGTCSIVLDDPERKYDPLNTESPYYGNIQPMRQVRVVSTVSGTDRTLFRGFVQEWPTDDGAGFLPVVTISAIDALSILAEQDLVEIDPAAHAGDLSGARVGRVLDLDEVDFPADLRDIDAGLSTFGATTLGENAAQYLQKVASSEGGALFVSRDGMLTFRERNSTSGSAAVVFSDDGDAAAVTYERVTRSPFGISTVKNRVTTSGTTGNVQTVEDAASREAYRVRQLTRTGQFVASDAEMLDQARWLLSRFKLPEQGFRTVTTLLDFQDASKQAALCGLELFDRVNVELTPPGGGSPAQLVQAGLVDGLAWSIDPKHDTVMLTVTLSAGERVLPLVLDDDDFGVLDTSRLGY